MKRETKELAGEVAHILIYGNHFTVLGFCDDDNDENHNCDKMGCSSTMCVLMRGDITELGASLKMYEA